jgi:hypothetical protein
MQQLLQAAALWKQHGPCHLLPLLLLHVLLLG